MERQDSGQKDGADRTEATPTTKPAHVYKDTPAPSPPPAAASIDTPSANETDKQTGIASQEPLSPTAAASQIVSTDDVTTRVVRLARTLRLGPLPTLDTAGERFAYFAVRARPILIRTARYIGYACVAYLALVLVLILAYRFVDPPGSALMAIRGLQGTQVNQTWVPLERISPKLVRAVVVAEDSRFCQHAGIDFEAMEQAIMRSGARGGASTITMQVTKNLFLWPSRSYLRKAIELTLTPIVDLVWPKWRILEIYLNVAEWGNGVFGAEAAARHHFRRSANRLSTRQAALMASVLPNPFRRRAGKPGRHTSRKARVVQARVRANRRIAACVTDLYPVQRQSGQASKRRARKKAKETRR